MTMTIARAAEILERQAHGLRSSCVDGDGKFGCEDCPNRGGVEACLRECEEIEAAAALVRSLSSEKAATDLVSITVDGSTHTRTADEWLALARADLSPSSAAPASLAEDVLRCIPADWRPNMARDYSKLGPILAEYIDDLREQKSAARSPIPAGWKLVPTEPNVPMLEAARKARPYAEDDGDEDAMDKNSHGSYVAMLEAAPQPPSPSSAIQSPKDSVTEGTVEQDAARFRFLTRNVRGEVRHVGHVYRRWWWDAYDQAKHFPDAIDDAMNARADSGVSQ